MDAITSVEQQDTMNTQADKIYRKTLILEWSLMRNATKKQQFCVKCNKLRWKLNND